MTDERTSPPPARLRDLLTYLAEHRGVLIVVLAISLLGAGLNLAQPIVVNRDIDAVGAGAGFGGMVVVLVGLVIARESPTRSSNTCSAGPPRGSCSARVGACSAGSSGSR